MSSSTKLKLLVALLSCLLSVGAFGQEVSADLLGTVKDASGAVVSNADVEATNLGTGYKATTKTNNNGDYRFSNLPAGHYSVQATAAGLKGGYQDINVQLNHVATANITATIAGASTTVEVSEQTATIDTTTPQIESTFDAKTISDAPLTSTGSGVINLSLLNAGVATQGGVGLGTGPSISGQRPRNNNFMVEGVDNNSKTITGPLIQIPNDAVDNFTVLQNQFSPEYGHSSGGQFNQSIKSGTNQFHGRLYEYFQNRNLNAIDTQAALAEMGAGFTKITNTPYDNNRYGGQIGGPIIKNKLFFFTDWEYNTIKNYSFSTACAPTATGYATLTALEGAGGVSATNLQQFQQYAGTAKSQAASNDLICPSMTTTTLLPSVPVGDVGFAGGYYTNTLTGVVSGDANLSEKDQLRARYAYEKLDGLDFAAQIPSFWTTSPQRFHLFTLGEYHNFSSSVNNEFRFGFNRYTQVFPSGNLTFPGLGGVYPNININEFNGVQLGPDPNAPQFTIQNMYQFIDNVSMQRGKHNITFGGEYRWYISPQGFTQRARGDYEWNTFEGYLLDTPPDFFGERSVGNATYYGNQWAAYGYANDQWRMTPNLTLSLGARYEFTQVPLSERQWQPLNSLSNVPGLITFNSPQAQTHNILPRVGFAYSPGGSGNTSIRGGFGMATDVLYDNLGILSAPPQVQQTCDVGSVTAVCNYSNTAFLGAGGLPFVATIPTNSPVFTDPATARSATGGWIPNQILPYSETWNIGFQHLFAQKYTLDVRYVGTRGLHLPVQDRINRSSPVNANSYLPTYIGAAPSQATLDGLPLTLAALQAQGSFVPSYLNAGFNSNVTAFMPWGDSKYNGLQVQFSRNFSNGLQFQVAYTWSHAEDNSTADVFSTFLTPRRPQDFQNVAADWSNSALDRRHRVTIEALYDLPFFKNSNWFAKNIIGNWQFTPIYTFQSPEYATVQSAGDSNLNHDTAGDRVIYNPAGVAGTGSDVMPLMNSAGDTVAYLAVNPNARYIIAGPGALATTPRNTLKIRNINNFDMSLTKRVNITERQSVEFQAQALNVFNHPQYLPGNISDVAPLSYTGNNVLQMLVPSSTTFNSPQSVFSNHPRQMVLVLKYNF